MSARSCRNTLAISLTPSRLKSTAPFVTFAVALCVIFLSLPSSRRALCRHCILADRLLEKRQQIGIDLVCVGRRHAMRKARIDLQRRVLQYLRGHQTCCADRHNLIVVTMHDEYGDVDFLQVFGEVGLRERLNAIVVGLDASQHALQPPVLTNTLRDLCARAIVSVKRKSYVLVELR